ncbi:MAG: putative bifunctional diguanylate cyclase/phosphodiesterase, partial [Guyparkeria sp.]|uniref:putative bifunctional diguanylate cyclase/phosphodiesterase n=1 Tax=Guyparkeria sp. TaxID=2035736 RepID=UPI00397CC667
DQVLGVIEFSISFAAIRREMERVAAVEGTHYQFIVRRELVETRLFEDFETLFMPAGLDLDYLIEDPRSSLVGQPDAPSDPDLVERLNRELAGDGRVERGMAEQTAFGVFARGAGATWAVNFVPVDNAEGRHAGYVVAYTPDSSHDEVVALSAIFWTVGTLAILGILLIHDRWRRSREAMRSVTEHLGAGLYLLDRAGRVEYANRAAGRILGYDRGELVGRDAHEMFHADEGLEGGGTGCALHEIPLRGKVYSTDRAHFRHRRGHLVPVDVISSPLELDGRITATVTIFRDITRAREVEQRLTQVSAAMGSSDEGMLVTDSDARILDVNRAFTRLTGYSREEVLGCNPRLLQSGRQDAAFYRSMWDAIERTGQWQGEIWNRRKNGEIYPEWLTISSIRDDAGRLTNYVGVFSDMSEIHATRDELERLARQDPLTGLANRSVFQDRLEHAVEHARRVGTGVAVLFVGLDRFKTINESMGHPVGDRLLMQVAGRIEQGVETDATVARIGGDTFGVIIEDERDIEAVEALADRLLEAILEPIHVGGREVIVSASIGLAMRPQHGDDGLTLMRNAETAMYRAKEQGGETRAVYSADLTSRAYDRLELETRMRRGLERDEFSVHYQPQVCRKTGRVCGAEALIRWDNPDLGRVSPGVFIPLAEETGQVASLGRWVLETACRQARVWQEEGLPTITVSVNLSANQLHDSALPAEVDAILSRTGLAPNCLELEVTETALMRHPREAIETLNALKSQGIGLAIDDFGTGYSSLSYLKNLPIDRLKIDKSFIDGLPEGEDDRAIVEAVVAMADRLGLAIIAEGVETEAQQAFLDSIGVDIHQGHFFAPALSSERLRATLLG